MRSLIPIVALLLLIGCAGNGLFGGGGTFGSKHHARARILVKKVGTACTIRTIPKSHAVIKGAGEEDELVWDIRVKDGCLDADELVIEWKDASKNPSQCATIATNTHGNKRQIKCDLKADPAEGTYPYKVTIGMLVEDPDVEIITF